MTALLSRVRLSTEVKIVADCGLTCHESAKHISLLPRTEKPLTDIARGRRRALKFFASSFSAPGELATHGNFTLAFGEKACSSERAFSHGRPPARLHVLSLATLPSFAGCRPSRSRVDCSGYSQESFGELSSGLSPMDSTSLLPTFTIRRSCLRFRLSQGSRAVRSSIAMRHMQKGTQRCARFEQQV